jgi:hypothetical protein
MKKYKALCKRVMNYNFCKILEHKKLVLGGIKSEDCFWFVGQGWNEVQM